MNIYTKSSSFLLSHRPVVVVVVVNIYKEGTRARVTYPYGLLRAYIFYNLYCEHRSHFCLCVCVRIYVFHKGYKLLRD